MYTTQLYVRLVETTVGSKQLNTALSRFVFIIGLRQRLLEPVARKVVPYM